MPRFADTEDRTLRGQDLGLWDSGLSLEIVADVMLVSRMTHASFFPRAAIDDCLGKQDQRLFPFARGHYQERVDRRLSQDTHQAQPAAYF